MAAINPMRYYDTSGDTSPGTMAQNPFGYGEAVTGSAARPAGYGGFSGSGAANPYLGTNLPRPTVLPPTPPAWVPPFVPGTPGLASTRIQEQAPGGPAVSGVSPVDQSYASAVMPPPDWSGSTPTNGTDPMSGWAGSMGYDLLDILGMNQMPSRYLGDVLGARGQDPTGGLFYMAEPLADIMMPLYELIYGNRPLDQSTGGFDPNHIANFMGGMWQSALTPGGRIPSTQELWGNMMAPTTEGTALNEYFNVGAPEERIDNFRRYAMMLGQLSGSPMYQQALSNYLSRRGYDYLRGFQGGQEPAGSFAQFIGNPGLGGNPGMGGGY